jgi:hypothetical protein
MRSSECGIKNQVCVIPQSELRIPHFPSAPARTRTWNVTFGEWHDSVSPPGQVSGRRGIRTLTPSRATTLAPWPGQPYPSPFRSPRRGARPVDPPGVEPGLPARQAGVIPLDHGPFVQWSRGESNPVAVFARHSPSPLAVPSVRLAAAVTSVGVEPTRLAAPALDRPCIPVPARGRGQPPAGGQLQTWESNPASRRMRPGRAPARLHSVPSGDGGIRTHTVHVLSVATPAGWSTSPCRAPRPSDPWGNRTPISSLRGWRRSR